MVRELVAKIYHIIYVCPNLRYIYGRSIPVDKFETKDLSDNKSDDSYREAGIVG